jgi:hypothetical protein
LEESAPWTDVDVAKAAIAACDSSCDIQITKAIGLPAENAKVASVATTTNAPNSAPVDDNTRAKRR